MSPTELEALLQNHPAVGEALVFGRPNPETQELICAAIVLNEGYGEGPETARVIEDYVSGKVNDYKRIRGGVFFRKELPRTGIGKLKRREMKMQMLEEVDKS